MKNSFMEYCPSGNAKGNGNLTDSDITFWESYIWINMNISVVMVKWHIIYSYCAFVMNNDNYMTVLESIAKTFVSYFHTK